MTASVTVLFPKEADAKYDINSYKTHRMPLMERLMGNYGLISWFVTTFTPGLDGSAPAFVFGSVATLSSAEAIKKAFADESAQQIMQHVSSFSNKHPTFLFSEIAV